MEKESINSLLVVLMLVAVGGFAILSDNGSNSESKNDEGENQQMDDEWEVYYVDSGDDLPNCNSDTLGRLYYVASTTNFEVCLTYGWSFIDIKGADGQDGADGADGQDADQAYIAELEAEMATLNATITQLQNNISSMEEELESVDFEL